MDEYFYCSGERSQKITGHCGAQVEDTWETNGRPHLGNIWKAIVKQLGDDSETTSGRQLGQKVKDN